MTFLLIHCLKHLSFFQKEISKYSNFKIEPIPTDGLVIEDPRKLLEINKQLYR